MRLSGRIPALLRTVINRCPSWRVPGTYVLRHHNSRMRLLSLYTTGGQTFIARDIYKKHIFFMENRLQLKKKNFFIVEYRIINEHTCINNTLLNVGHRVFVVPIRTLCDFCFKQILTRSTLKSFGRPCCIRLRRTNITAWDFSAELSHQ